MSDPRTSSAVRSPHSENTIVSPPCPWYARTWVRLAVCFVFVTTVPLVMTAIYVTQRHVAVIREVAASTALYRVDQSAQRFEDLLGTARSDLLALAEWPIWESYLAADTEDDRNFWQNKLSVQLRTMAELKPMYQSITFSSDERGETIRLERRGTVTNVSTADNPRSAAEQELLNATIQSAPRQALWQTSSGPDGFKLRCGARAATRVGDARSAVWLTLSGEVLLGSAGAVDTETTSLALYDGAGGLVYPRSTSAPESLPAHHPRQFVDDKGRLINLTAVSGLTGDGLARWHLAHVEPAHRLDAGVHDFRAAFLSLIGVALLIAAALSVWLARQFSRPLGRVYVASERIGRGQFDIQLSDSTGDEIGALAERINTMAGQLKAAHTEFERRLSEKTEQLVHAERLSTIGRTTAAVAHEINNPSGIISLYAQMLTEQLPADDPNLEKLHIIKNKAREISQIVGELLDYSRKPAPQKEWVGTDSLVARALHDAKALQSEEDATGLISESVDIDAGAEKLYVDSHQMGRALRNLIHNARQAMAAGGDLRVRVRPGASLGTTIEIADTGTGMDAEQLQHLFDPFYTTKRFGAGTGLGMAISKEITDRHGGTITVQSQAGQGTTVTIWLPEQTGTYEI